MTTYLSAVKLITGDVVKHYLSEFIGTFIFVFIGWGAVMFARPFIGYLGVSLAFGLAYSAACLTFPEGHFNPAATVSAALSGMFRTGSKAKTALNAIGYILVQTAGACAAAAVVRFICSEKAGYVPAVIGNIHLIDRYTLSAAFCLETILNLIFLCVFLKHYSNPEKKTAGCGLFITAAYLISYPVTKGGLNPAKSTATAFFGGEEALEQLSVFWYSALLAALTAGIIYNPSSKKALLRKKN